MRFSRFAIVRGHYTCHAKNVHRLMRDRAVGAVLRVRVLGRPAAHATGDVWPRCHAVGGRYADRQEADVLKCEVADVPPPLLWCKQLLIVGTFDEALLLVVAAMDHRVQHVRHLCISKNGSICVNV